jgi:ProP effector
MNKIYVPDKFRSVLDRYPSAFNPENPMPLKIGIVTDLIQAGVAPWQAGHTCRIWCSSSLYLQAVIDQSIRIDLEGNPCGVVTDVHKEHARNLIQVAIEREKEGRTSGKVKKTPFAGIGQPETDKPRPQVEVKPEPVRSGRKTVLVAVRKRKAIDSSSPWAAPSVLKTGNQ